MEMFDDQKDHEFWLKFYLGEKTTGSIRIKASWVFNKTIKTQKDIKQLEDGMAKTQKAYAPIEAKINSIQEEIEQLLAQ